MKRCALLIVVVACGGKEPASVAPPSNVVVQVPVDARPIDAAKDGVELTMETMSAFADDMCKCIDKACTDTVQERMNKWSTQMAQEAGNQSSKTRMTATEDELKRMTEIGTRYGECMYKAANGGSGATP